MTTRRPQIGVLAARVSSDMRRRHQAAKLYRLGERATIEFLSEIAVRADAVEILDDMLADCCRLDRHVLRAVGGERWSDLIREVA